MAQPNPAASSPGRRGGAARSVILDPLTAGSHPDALVTGVLLLVIGLLVGIGGPGRSARRFSWKPNAGAARGDSLWPAPVHLATDDANTFSYGLSARGFIIDVHQAAPGGDRRVVFNPVRRRLEYRGSREKLVVTFLPGTAGRSPVGQVEDGCGGLLESYRYGADGRVLAVTRRSEPGFNASAGGPGVEARLEDAGPPETPLP